MAKKPQRESSPASAPPSLSLSGGPDLNLSPEPATTPPDLERMEQTNQDQMHPQLRAVLRWMEDRGPQATGRIAASVFTEIPVTNPVEWVGGLENFGNRCFEFIRVGFSEGPVPYLLPLALHLVTTTGIGADPKNFAYILLRIAANNVACGIAVQRALQPTVTPREPKPSEKLVIVTAT